MPNKVTYEDNGFNNFLSRKKSVVSDTEFTGSIKRPQVTGENIITDVPVLTIQEQINKAAQRTGTTIATSPSIGDGIGVTLSSTIRLKGAPNAVTIALCEVTVYVDNISSSYILPYGTFAQPADHRYMAWYDRNKGQLYGNPGKTLTYNVFVYNGTGGSHVYSFYINWRYFGGVGNEGVEE